MSHTQQILTAAAITAGLFLLPLVCVVALGATGGLVAWSLAD